MSLVKNINYKTKNFSISIAEMEIPDQGLTLLSGESGSGKSTLVDLLVGFKQAKGMSWVVGEIDYCQKSIKEKKIGLVLQGGVLFPHLSVKDCVRFAAKSRGRKESSVDNELSEYMSELHLSKKLLLQKAAKLSGGERQRVAFICALIGSPKILLLDEPFSALDSTNRQGAMSLLHKYISRNQVPALLITHNPEPNLQLKAHYNLLEGRLIN